MTLDVYSSPPPTICPQSIQVKYEFKNIIFGKTNNKYVFF